MDVVERRGGGVFWERLHNILSNSALAFAAVGEDKARCAGDSRPAVPQVLPLLPCQEEKNDTNHGSRTPQFELS